MHDVFIFAVLLVLVVIICEGEFNISYPLVMGKGIDFLQLKFLDPLFLNSVESL